MIPVPNAGSGSSEKTGATSHDQGIFGARERASPGRQRRRLCLPHYSYLIAGLIPQARVKIYPDSAHGFLFQHHAEFAADIGAFLTGAS